MVTDLNGEIDQTKAQGVFAEDTCFLSTYQLYINDQPWERVAAAAVTSYAARLELTNPRVLTPDGRGTIEERTIALTLERQIDAALFETFHIVNYSADRCLEWIDTHGDLDGDGFQDKKDPTFPFRAPQPVRRAPPPSRSSIAARTTRSMAGALPREPQSLPPPKAGPGTAPISVGRREQVARSVRGGTVAIKVSRTGPLQASR